jgi:cytochrome c-type biogenesis protein CcmH/NrfG
VASLEARMLAQANEAMRIDPQYPEPSLLLGLYYYENDIDRSLAYFSRLNELVPNDRTVLDLVNAAIAKRDQAQP